MMKPHVTSKEKQLVQNPYEVSYTLGYTISHTSYTSLVSYHDNRMQLVGKNIPLCLGIYQQWLVDLIIYCILQVGCPRIQARGVMCSLHNNIFLFSMCSNCCFRYIIILSTLDNQLAKCSTEVCRLLVPYQSARSSILEWVSPRQCISELSQNSSKSN